MQTASAEAEQAVEMYEPAEHEVRQGEQVVLEVTVQLVLTKEPPGQVEHGLQTRSEVAVGATVMNEEPSVQVVRDMQVLAETLRY